MKFLNWANVIVTLLIIKYVGLVVGLVFAFFVFYQPVYTWYRFEKSRRCAYLIPVLPHDDMQKNPYRCQLRRRHRGPCFNKDRWDSAAQFLQDYPSPRFLPDVAAYRAQQLYRMKAVDIHPDLRYTDIN